MDFALIWYMNSATNPFSGEFISVDGQIIQSRDFDWNRLIKSKSAYEVLRIMRGKPLFLKDHHKRFQESIQFLGLPSKIAFKKLATDIHRLCDYNGTVAGNVKLLFSVTQPDVSKTNETILMLGMVPHVYPTQAAYDRGIAMKTLQLERPNPNAKIIHQSINEKVNQLKTQTGADEILLVNHDGIITEGSKSNVFFIVGQRVVTAEKNLVLGGITREKIIELCMENGLETEVCKPHLEMLDHASGAFITGTSPKVMPVRQIDNYTFNPDNPMVKKLQRLYDNEIETDLRNYSI